MKTIFFGPNPNETRGMALIYLVFGILLCFFGTNILLNAARILGVVLLVYGAWLLYVYFGKRRSANPQPLITGIPMILFGLILAMSPATLVAIFPIVIAILIIINSVIQMQRAFMLKDARYPGWIYTFIVALIMLLGGVILMLRPIQALSYVLKIAGILLIIESLTMLWQSFSDARYLR